MSIILFKSKKFPSDKTGSPLVNVCLPTVISKHVCYCTKKFRKGSRSYAAEFPIKTRFYEISHIVLFQ